MRKYRNGLCAIVQDQMDRSVFTNSLFIFTNKRKRIIRFLYWDKTGFAIWTKTLDKQKYRWPKDFFELESLIVTSGELQLLLQGIDITRHKTLDYENVF